MFLNQALPVQKDFIKTMKILFDFTELGLVVTDFKIHQFDKKLTE